MNVDFNTDANRIEIPLSKGKLVLLFIGSLCFVVVGVWFIISPSTFADAGYSNRPIWEIETAGYAAVIFFGACACFIAYKLFDNKPGLIIDRNGITDNSSAVSVGFIGWGDIQKLGIKDVFRQKFILIYINDADEYIKRQNNIFKRKAISGNYKLYGTPITITSNGLKCNFDKLYSLLTEKLKIYKEDSKR